LDLLSDAVEDKRTDALREDFADFFAFAQDGFADVEYYWDGVQEILNILDITEGSLIYTPSQPVIESPKLIRAVSDELIRLLANRPDLLYTVEPRKFEELIAELFYRNGFHVELMKQTRDGGKDIIAIYNSMGILTKYVIECKRYSQSNKVSLGIVQRLLGVKISNSANKAILATTSTFTKDAIEFRSNHIWDLELRDYGDIVGWLKNTAG
jgi:restriction system protein